MIHLVGFASTRIIDLILNMDIKKRAAKQELHSSLRYKQWQGQKESNPRHADLESAALPAELYPYDYVIIPQIGRFVKGVRQIFLRSRENAGKRLNSRANTSKTGCSQKPHPIYLTIRGNP